ncbi:DUF6924 domain-containing protein [Actinophytocola sp.]|uniref:DUF6924 domain-containing protein n=1 Tax=Actinophytocola sp. TaxID=1872138 RepID=UPI002D54AAED|nr:hypothetical protein [Actinophytocola sp.]HYQ66485.1 hypothetical protein [Actinophytocola sp.]
MRPVIEAADGGVALIVRTSYADDAGWRSVVTALDTPPFVGAVPANQYVDDPAWDGATVDEVLAAVPSMFRVVFVADAAAMVAPHPLLAANTVRAEDCDDEQYAYELENGREFRALPAGVYDVSANLFVDNMDFPEYAAMALRDPAGHYQGLAATDRGRMALDAFFGSRG